MPMTRSNRPTASNPEKCSSSPSNKSAATPPIASSPAPINNLGPVRIDLPSAWDGSNLQQSLNNPNYRPPAPAGSGYPDYYNQYIYGTYPVPYGYGYPSFGYPYIYGSGYYAPGNWQYTGNTRID